jgi:hypothetical protein
VWHPASVLGHFVGEEANLSRRGRSVVPGGMSRDFLDFVAKDFELLKKSGNNGRLLERSPIIIP